MFLSDVIRTCIGPWEADCRWRLAASTSDLQLGTLHLTGHRYCNHAGYYSETYIKLSSGVWSSSMERYIEGKSRANQSLYFIWAYRWSHGAANNFQLGYKKGLWMWLYPYWRWDGQLPTTDLRPSIHLGKSWTIWDQWQSFEEDQVLAHWIAHVVSYFLHSVRSILHTGKRSQVLCD